MKLDSKFDVKINWNIFCALKILCWCFQNKYIFYLSTLLFYFSKFLQFWRKIFGDFCRFMIRTVSIMTQIWPTKSFLFFVRKKSTFKKDCVFCFGQICFLVYKLNVLICTLFQVQLLLLSKIKKDCLCFEVLYERRFKNPLIECVVRYVLELVQKYSVQFDCTDKMPKHKSRTNQKMSSQISNWNPFLRSVSDFCVNAMLLAMKFLLCI